MSDVRLQDITSLSVSCLGECVGRKDQAWQVHIEVDIDIASVKYVNEFFYLGDTICADDMKASSIAMNRSGWMKFWELLPLLTIRRFSLSNLGNLYNVCVKEFYNCETWAIKTEDGRTEMRMEMCTGMGGISLNDGSAVGRILVTLQVP